MKRSLLIQHLHLDYWTMILVVFVFHDSHPCPENYFDPMCRYTCNCKATCSLLGYCDDNGCKRGYFGYHCQYRDLATHWDLPTTIYTDGDDTTCQDDDTVTSVKIPMPIMTMTFFMVTISPEPTSKEMLEEMTYELEQNGKKIMCDNWNVTNFIDNNIIYVYCLTSVNVTSITLHGKAVALLCTVNISGGRNVAINQPIRFTPLDQYAARHAGGVDGLYPTSGALNPVTCFKGSENITKSIYEITLDVPKLISYFMIINTPEALNMKKLAGFKIITRDDKNKTISTYEEGSNPPGGRPNYTVPHSAALVPVKYIRLEKDNALNFCELEAYGDCLPGYRELECLYNCTENCVEGICELHGKCLECKVGYWGKFCQRVCGTSCVGNLCEQNKGGCILGCLPGYFEYDCYRVCENCIYNNCTMDEGLCIGGCKKGFQPPSCTDECVNGYYGINCSSQCGARCPKECTKDEGYCLNCQPKTYGRNCEKNCFNCKQEQCDQKTGNCTLGCKDGFKEFDCSLTCSNCKDGKCHQETGNCTLGCNFGYKGFDCSLSASEWEILKENYTLQLAIVGFIFFVLVVLLLARLLRKKTPPPQSVVAVGGGG
ncbi:multiple epidermal growth factor domains protein 10 isoform X7 [Biomphalaria glabrata]|nr:multiple epidermal growth factor domains protein 10 isoform X7 [Biomphalaria glabrata]